MESDKPAQIDDIVIRTLTHLFGTAFAGSASALTSNVLFQPLDVIKTRQQVFSGGFIKTIRIIATEDGILGFWRGTGPTIWRILPGSALYFYTLDLTSQKLKSKFYPDSDKLPTEIALLSAAISRSIACLTFLPFTVVKTKFEALGNARTYTGTFNAIVKIYKNEGISSLYRGAIPTLLRDVPNSSIYYGFYSQLKPYLEIKLENQPSVIINFTAGMFSGLMATLITHPFDVMKSKLQAQIVYNYEGIIDLIKKISKYEGKRTYIRGFLPRIMRRTLSVACTWTFYEHISSLFIKKKQ